MAKPLATILLIVNGVYVMSGAVDPSAGAGVLAPVGSIFLRSPALPLLGQTWLKLGPADTDWVNFRAVFTATVPGLVPPSGGGTANYLRADQIFAPIVESSPGWFGNGIDGAKVVVGTEQLTADMFFTTLVIPNGAVLLPGGYRIYCSVSCTVDVGGAIRRDGGDATGSTAGIVAAGTGLLGNGTGGSNGSTGSAGATTGSSTQPRPLPLTGPTSGAGGRGGGNAVVGTATGAITQASPTFGNIWTMPWAGMLRFMEASNNITGGIGGTGGNGSGSVILGSGGGGGAGGGCFTLVSRLIANSGTISAHGGNGGNAQGANGGGGAAGGGGKIILCTRDYSGAGTVDVTGGVGGAGTGTFLNGAVGSTGYSIVFPV